MLEDFQVMRVIFPFDFFPFYCANLIIKCPPSDNYVLPPLLAEILNKRTGAYSRKFGIQIYRLAGKWFVGLSRVLMSFTAFPFRGYFLAHYFFVSFSFLDSPHYENFCGKSATASIPTMIC